MRRTWLSPASATLLLVHVCECDVVVGSEAPKPATTRQSTAARRNNVTIARGRIGPCYFFEAARLRVFFGAGPFARRSLMRSLARSRVMVNGSSATRSEALVSPSVT